VTTLYSFSSSDGTYPWAGLVQGTDGTSTEQLTWAGPTTMDGFQNHPRRHADHAAQLQFHGWRLPNATLVQATNGNFYGTTDNGGTNNYGTVFKITPTGTLTTLHSFDYTDGDTPNASLVASNGNFYGTTWLGGTDGDGTIFEITPQAR